MDDLILRAGNRPVEEVDRLLLGVERLAGELPRPLERRVGEVRPEALQVGLPVGCARHAVAPLCREAKRRQHETGGHQDDSVSHCPFPFWYLP